MVREGIKPEQIIVTGSPMLEVLNYNKEKIERSKILEDLQLTPKKYFLFSSHREENVDNDENLKEIFLALSSLYDQYSIPIIFSTHPRTRKNIEKQKLVLPKGVRFEKPFGFIEYIRLQKDALCVVSDSGTISEETSMLKFCSVNLRNSHERPEGIEEMVCIMSGLNHTDILNSVQLAIKLHEERSGSIDYLKVNDYTETDVSSKIAGIIQSYTHYVNRFVWHKFV